MKWKCGDDVGASMEIAIMQHEKDENTTQHLNAQKINETPQTQHLL